MACVGEGEDVRIDEQAELFGEVGEEREGYGCVGLLGVGHVES